MVVFILVVFKIIENLKKRMLFFTVLVIYSKMVKLKIGIIKFGPLDQNYQNKSMSHTVCIPYAYENQPLRVKISREKFIFF